MTREEMEKCWKDPHNSRWGLYYCKADPRLIVPKRIKWMGWTINAAHPEAFLVLLGMLALLIVPTAIVAANGGGTASTFLAEGASILVLCLLSVYLSSTERWSRG